LRLRQEWTECVFFAFTIILGQKVPWPNGPGIVFWAGVLFLFDFCHADRETIAKAIPRRYESGRSRYRDIFDVPGLRNAGFIAA